MIPYGKQSIDESDVAAVVEALRSDWLTTGPKVVEFEERFAEYVGAKHAIAVCNGTAALHLAMLVADIGPGDRVITSPNTFLASANCAAFVGATPDFCDIDPITYNMCPMSLEQVWRDDVRAVVAVDYAGQSSDIPAIAEIARSRGAVVVEDASHAVGSGFVHDGRVWKIGGHPWADMTTFSFHPVKTMTTGEGGMLVTDNDKYAARARLMRNHGMVRDADCFVGLGNGKQASLPVPSSSEYSPLATRHSPLVPGPWYYEMQALGFNYRISEIQCALGLSQFARLDKLVARRREIVRRYNDAFRDLEFATTPRLSDEQHTEHISWHLYTLLIEFDALGKTRTQVMDELREQGIGSQVLYIPVYLQPWYRQSYGYQPGKCPVAEDYYERTLSLPLFPAMSDEDVDRVVAAMELLSVPVTLNS